MNEENKNVVVIKKENEETAELMQKVFKMLGGLEDIIKPDYKVLIKPNFVAPFEKATTDIDILREVVREVKRLGAKPFIGESSGFEFSTEATFKILGIDKMAAEEGVQLINFDEQEYVGIKVNDFAIKQFLVPKIVLESDCIINLPKLKGHALTKVTFGIKNLFGIIHRNTRRKIHAFNLEKGIYKLYEIIKPQLTIVDGLWMLSKAVYSNADYKGIIVAGKDVRLVDYVCCSIYGIGYQDVKHIKMALDETLINSINLISCNYDLARIAGQLSVKAKLSYIKHNFVYRCVYVTDLLISRITGRDTIIPNFHLLFGLRPDINKEICNKCGVCRQICPIDCISEKYEINYEKCKYVRCMKCKNSCPIEAIKIKGFHK